MTFNFFKCKVCAEKDKRIEYLEKSLEKAQAALMRNLPVSYSEGVVDSGYSKPIELDFISENDIEMT